MTAAASPAVALQIDERVSATVREGLTSRPKRLPAWLFYDEEGSRLFDAITELPEYYVTVSYTHLDVYKRQSIYSPVAVVGVPVGFEKELLLLAITPGVREINV